MRKNKGFTLIEVMVVLSILALVAILAYNFFGSTMKEARLKKIAINIHKQMEDIETTYGLYGLKTGVYLTTSSFVDSTHPLVTSGILRAPPSADERNGTPYSDFFNLRFSGINLTGSAAQDYAIQTAYYDDDICKKYNELFTRLGPTIYARDVNNWEDVNAASPFYCAKTFTADINKNFITRIVVGN